MKYYSEDIEYCDTTFCVEYCMDGGEFEDFSVQHAGADITEIISENAIEGIQELCEAWKEC